MPWCPKCEAEYRPGFEVCSDCSEKLVDVPPAEKTPASFDYQGGWALLSNFYSAREADMLTAWLRAEGIPVLKQPRGAGQYMEVYLGMTSDVDLYVPEDSLEIARALISHKAPPVYRDDTSENSFSRRQSIGKTIILILVLIPFLIGLVIALIQQIIE